MHHLLNLIAQRRDRADERGAVAVIVTLMVTALVVASAMVMDLGLVRVDRQVNKSAADAAAIAGVNGLSTGDGDARAFRGVCTALRYLQRNDPRFVGVTDTSGTWTDALGGAKANGCTDTTVRNQVCTANQTSWAKYTWNGTYDGQPLQAVIQSGYRLDTGTSSWQEESLPAVQADNLDGAGGCDQLAVVVTQNRKPGLGAVVHPANIVSKIRSVARVRSAPGGDAPAMLLLKQTGCPVLQVGSSGGGASSYVHVRGSISSDGTKAQPGSIHADSDGTSCSTNVFMGKATDGIVTYAAPLVGNPSQPDPTKPGHITSVAGGNGVSIGTVRDAAANVYGSAAIDESGSSVAAKTDPSGRGLVTRRLVDERYLGLPSSTSPTTTGVTAAINTANSTVFSLTATTAPAAGWTVLTGCTPTIPGTITAASKVYVDCTANGGYKGASIPAGTVYFAGKVAPTGTLSLPNAHHVYVGGSSSDAIILGNGNTLSVHTAGNLTGSTCSNAFTGSSTNKAIVFVKDGGIKESGGLLQLCNTTMILMGGSGSGCLPTTTGTAPTATPCGGSNMGSGQISQTGGGVDWTAPNQYDVMNLPNGEPNPLLASAWTDVNGPEDLALWSESAGNTSSATYNMNGGGQFHVRGVFMVPNADSFQIGGGAHQDLTNAQYIAASIALSGSTQLTMSVDPNSAVTLPKLKTIGLVR